MPFLLAIPAAVGAFFVRRSVTAVVIGAGVALFGSGVRDAGEGFRNAAIGGAVALIAWNFAPDFGLRRKRTRRK